MPNIGQFTQNSFLLFNALLAGVFFLIDEPMHVKRGLSKWERISHIIDALLTALTFFIGYLTLNFNLSVLFWIYCLIALITISVSFKDEFIHTKECKREEHLVHAFMFSANSISYVLGAFMILLKIPSWPFVLGSICALLAAFWQFIFWFFIYNRHKNVSLLK